MHTRALQTDARIYDDLILSLLTSFYKCALSNISLLAEKCLEINIDKI